MLYFNCKEKRIRRANLGKPGDAKPCILGSEDWQVARIKKFQAAN